MSEFLMIVLLIYFLVLLIATIYEALAYFETFTIEDTALIKYIFCGNMNIVGKIICTILWLTITFPFWIIAGIIIAFYELFHL